MNHVSIDYDHQKNIHTLAGAGATLAILFEAGIPGSLLDVGCGAGTWLKAAIMLGVADVFGVDGVEIPTNQLLIPPHLFRQQNLMRPWRLNRRFDVALCLEVAEHLEPRYGPTLIDSLIRHSDTVFFSAACPGQGGQHHVNCQWPSYWQALFNERGFVCSDNPRWRIWDDSCIEPWYRQNLFLARRDGSEAGREPRIRAVVHPVMWETLASSSFSAHIRQIQQGQMTIGWYLHVPFRAMAEKMKRRLRT